MPTEYYYSDAIPLEADKSVYIWKNATNNCYHFLTLPSSTDEGKNIPIIGMTIHATCNDCTVLNIESCLLWDIHDEGTSSNFLVSNNGEKCRADNWVINNTSITPQNQPADICMHNTNQYNPTFNDQPWELFSIDSAGNPYYFIEGTGRYLSQYLHNETDEWYWIQHETQTLSYQQSEAYCKINNYPIQSIIDCKPWYFQSNITSSQYSLYNVTINDHDCSFISDNICVYDSTLNISTFNKDINGDYAFWDDILEYDGFSKLTGDLAYIRFQDNTWKIGYANDLSTAMYSICNNSIANIQINPFDITSCNGYWQLPNKPCCDTLTISNTICADRPTRAPTITPSVAPSIAPTIPPTISPSYSPTISPTITPTQTTYQPTMSPITPTTIISITNIVTSYSTISDENNDKATVLETWFNPSNSNFIFVILISGAIFFLFVAAIISCVCCWKKYTDRKQREQITMDVSEKVTNNVKSVVAQATKEIILASSMAGSAYRSASPMGMNSTNQHNNNNTNMYGVAHVGSQPGSQMTTPKQMQRFHSNSNPMRLNGSHLQVSNSPAMHIHIQPSMNHLSPNYNSSMAMSSPNNPKVSMDSHSEIYDSVPVELFNNKSPYTRSNAILSPDRHNSYRESNSKSPNINLQQNMAYFCTDTNDVDTIPDIPPSERSKNDNISVNYDDAHVDEKESMRKVSSNISKYRKVSSQISKMYGINQPDVFPEEDNEGAETQETTTGIGNIMKCVIKSKSVKNKEGYNSNDNKSIGKCVKYNNLQQIESHLRYNEEDYNSSSEQDEDEKHIQNDATLGSLKHSNIEIEMQNRRKHNNEPSDISIPYEKYEQQYNNNNNMRSQSHPHPHGQFHHGNNIRKHTGSSSMRTGSYNNDYGLYQQVPSNTMTNNNGMSNSRYLDVNNNNVLHDDVYDDEVGKLMEKIMLDKSSSCGDPNEEEEADIVGPLRSELIEYKKQMQYGQQLSPIMNTNKSNLHFKRKSKSGSEMSESHKSGKSFLTLNDEHKQIEISNIDLDDGLDDIIDDDSNSNNNTSTDSNSNSNSDQQSENGPLLSNGNNSGNTDELIQGDMDEFEIGNDNKYNEYMKSKKKMEKHKNWKNRHHKKVATHSQSFDVNGKIENPFKVIGIDISVEHSNISSKNDGARNEDESFDFNDQSHTRTHTHTHYNGDDNATNTMSFDEMENEFDNHNINVKGYNQ